MLTKYNVKVLHANSSLWKAWAQLLFNGVSHKDEVWTIWTQFVTWLHCLKTHEHESAHQTHCKKTNQKKNYLFTFTYSTLLEKDFEKWLEDAQIVSYKQELSWINIYMLYNWAEPFHSQDLISDSPFYLPHNSYDVSLDN